MFDGEAGGPNRVCVCTRLCCDCRAPDTDATNCRRRRKDREQRGLGWAGGPQQGQEQKERCLEISSGEKTGVGGACKATNWDGVFGGK